MSILETIPKNPDDVLQPGNYYGYPKEIWDAFDVGQKQAAASIFALAHPELALAAGAQEFLETNELHLTVAGLKTLE